MKSVYIETMTCDRRGLDAARVKAYLLKNQYRIARRPEEADVILFFGCAALKSISERTLEKIQLLKRYDADLIIAGCLPDIEKQRLSAIFQGRVMTTKELHRIETLFPGSAVPFSTIEDANIVFRNIPERTIRGTLQRSVRALPPVHAAFGWARTKILRFVFGKSALLYKYVQEESTFHIRISTGCRGQCTYCVIHRSVGPSVSKPLEICISEFKKGLADGYTHFVLDGDDVGAYGLDIGTTFPALLQRILQVSGTYFLDINNLNPVWLVTYIDALELLFRCERIVTIHCPIQSGSERILRAMHRFPDTVATKDAFLRLKRACPDVSVTTDYIIGFPTETAEDFQGTLDYLTAIGVDGGMVISFSCMDETEAAQLTPQIPPEVVKGRLRAARRHLRRRHFHTLTIRGFRAFLFFKSSPADRSFGHKGSARPP